jgi:predicted Zn-dependent protease
MTKDQFTAFAAPKHRAARAFWSAVLLAGIMLSGIEAASAMTDAEEIALGKRMTGEAAGYWAPELPATSPESRRVQRIGARFARLSSRRAIPFSYRVLNDYKTLNAFAAPGGPIFITVRLVKFAHNDAELASILGHETAHIEQKHMSKRLDNYKRAQHSAALLSKKVLGPRGARRHEDLWRGLTNVAFALRELGYSREAESEADQLSARWMSRLGYDPRATVDIFNRMQATDKRSVPELQRYFSTHPPMLDRVKQLQSLIDTEHLLQVAQKFGGPRLNDMVAKGKVQVVTALTSDKMAASKPTKRKMKAKKHRR